MFPRCALPVSAMSQQTEAGTRTHVTVSSRFLVCFDRLTNVARFLLCLFFFLCSVLNSVISNYKTDVQVDADPYSKVNRRD